MNERIRELAGQALDKAVPETWTTLTGEQLGRFQEVFAELIVQECAAVAKLNTWADSKVNEMIKQHFGVEQ